MRRRGGKPRAAVSSAGSTGWRGRGGAAANGADLGIMLEDLGFLFFFFFFLGKRRGRDLAPYSLAQMLPTNLKNK